MEEGIGNCLVELKGQNDDGGPGDAARAAGVSENVTCDPGRQIPPPPSIHTVACGKRADTTELLPELLERSWITAKLDARCSSRFRHLYLPLCLCIGSDMAMGSTAANKVPTTRRKESGLY